MPVNSFENYPMTWKPVLDNESTVPIYICLSNLLKKDIMNGTLAPGTKLPPQRELADYLDINLSTITRAFKLCEQRGLICSVVGRGTFISSDAAANGMLTIRDDGGKIMELGPILPNPDIGEIVTGFLKEIVQEPDFYKLLQYAPINYDDLQIKACTRWMGYFGLNTDKENILISSGSQNAIFAILSSLFKEGDKIATTPVTYPGLKVAAKSLGIQVIPMPLKNGRITRESLEYVEKNHDVKGYYIIPDFNNPSGEQMDLETRRSIAEFCNEKKLPFIEDAIYSLFLPKPLPPVSSFSKDYGILVASTSKIMSPGLRLAIIHVPAIFHELVSKTLYATIITPPALMMQLFTRLVNTGRFEQIRQLRIDELVVRNRLFDELIPHANTVSNPHCPIRWLFLPENVDRRAADFENEMLNKNVHLYASDRFVVGSESIPRAVRISLISEHSIEKFKEALILIEQSLTK